MLEMRPNCECCDKDLAVTAGDAMICSFECTFCADCTERILHDVCPNCNGGFAPRPVRSAAMSSRNPGSSARVLSDDPRCRSMREAAKAG